MRVLAVLKYTAECMGYLYSIAWKLLAVSTIVTSGFFIPTSKFIANNEHALRIIELARTFFVSLF